MVILFLFVVVMFPQMCSVSQWQCITKARDQRTQR